MLCSPDINLHIPQNLTFAPHQQGEFFAVWLAAGFDEHDHLLMWVFGDVPPIYQQHLISLHERRHTATGLKHSRY